MERRRLRAVQNLELVRQHLDVAGRHVGVDRPLRPLPNLALHSEHEFAANPLRLGEDFGAVRVENDLQQSLTVSQIDEYDAAVVATAVHPAAYRHLFADH